MPKIQQIACLLKKYPAKRRYYCFYIYFRPIIPQAISYESKKLLSSDYENETKFGRFGHPPNVNDDVFAYGWLHSRHLCRHANLRTTIAPGIDNVPKQFSRGLHYTAGR